MHRQIWSYHISPASRVATSIINITAPLIFTEAAALPAGAGLGLLLGAVAEGEEEGAPDADALALGLDGPDGSFPVPVNDGTVP